MSVSSGKRNAWFHSDNQSERRRPHSLELGFIKEQKDAEPIRERMVEGLVLGGHASIDGGHLKQMRDSTGIEVKNNDLCSLLLVLFDIRT